MNRCSAPLIASAIIDQRRSGPARAGVQCMPLLAVRLQQRPEPVRRGHGTWRIASIGGTPADLAERLISSGSLKPLGALHVHCASSRFMRRSEDQSAPYFTEIHRQRKEAAQGNGRL